MNTLLEYIGYTPIYAQLLIAFGFALLLAFAKRTRTTVFWLMAMMLTFWFWTSVNASIDTNNLPFYLPGGIHVPRTLLYIFGGLFLVRVTQVLADTIRYRYNMDDANNLRERKILTQLQYIQRIASIVIFIVVVSFILLQFDGMRNLAVAVTDTTDRVIVIRILVSSGNAGNTFTLRCNTREHLLAWVRENYPDKLPTTRSEKGQQLTPGVIEENNEN